jgi:hypothetical protein
MGGSLTGERRSFTMVEPRRNQDGTLVPVTVEQARKAGLRVPRPTTGRVDIAENPDVSPLHHFAWSGLGAKR